MTQGLPGPFGLDRDMGYTRAEFFALLPTAFAEYEFIVDGDVVSVKLPQGEVLVRVGAQRERRLSELVRFPILPVSIEFAGASPTSQVAFIKRFDLAYMKGLA